MAMNAVVDGEDSSEIYLIQVLRLQSEEGNAKLVMTSYNG